jgi:hypothetical protein
MHERPLIWRALCTHQVWFNEVVVHTAEGAGKMLVVRLRRSEADVPTKSCLVLQGDASQTTFVPVKFRHSKQDPTQVRFVSRDLWDLYSRVV